MSNTQLKGARRRHFLTTQRPDFFWCNMSQSDSTIEPLYLKEERIAALVGVPLKDWSATAIVLERHGLPRRDPLFHDLRCWPAVRAFLLERARPSVSERSTEEVFRGFSSSRTKGNARSTEPEPEFRGFSSRRTKVKAAPRKQSDEAK